MVNLLCFIDRQTCGLNPLKNVETFLKYSVLIKSKFHTVTMNYKVKVHYGCVMVFLQKPQEVVCHKLRVYDIIMRLRPIFGSYAELRMLAGC